MFKHTVAATLLVLACCLVQVLYADLLPDHSFHEPFEDLDYKGDRRINLNWRVGGHASVKKSFVRLTPERQSRRGYLWNPNRIGRDEFSILLRFRISGTGQRWFGDGLALWVTNDRFHRDGPLHGYADKFTGFGVIFDTFRNVEHAGGHKDVALVMNDGTKAYTDLVDEEVVGCDASMRYYEEHGKFSVANHTRARISFNKNKVKIEIDEAATGTWVDCYETTLSGLPADWTKESYLGITASTGALADNHDVLSVELFSEWNDKHQQFHDQYTKHKSQVDLKSHDGTPEGIVQSLQAQFARLQEDYEHQIASLKESTRGALEKLTEQEALLEKRTAELENVVKQTVEQSVDSTLGEFASAVDEKITETIKEASAGGGWKLPFFLLVLVAGGFGYYSYAKYKQLRKSHLL